MVKPRHPARLIRALPLLGVALAALAALAAPAAAQVTRLKVGWCARTVSAAAAPFAIATKLGWLRQEGIDIELVPMPGSTDCVKNVAVREVDFSLPSVEPLAVGRPQGIKAQVFYTAYQGNIYGIAVPQDSPVKNIGDLRGKRVGVISMASGGVLVARELIRAAGLDPDQDVNIVVAGEGAQTAAMVRSGQVDALSQFDTQYAMVENAGVKLRLLDTRAIDRFPSNGFLALEETLRARRKEAVALARSYAKGTVFAIANPEAAIRILWEVFPATKPTGKDEATALRDDTKVLQARAQNWRLEKAGVKRWGENSEANYQAYADFMLKTGIIKQPITAKELVTNELVDEINRFDPEKIAAEARAYRVGG
jgi:NitT/TauT family transport system substrate-binding protein